MNTDALDRMAIALVGEHDVLLAVAPIFPPLAKRQHHREQCLALGAERVNNLPTIIGVSAALENAAFDQFAESIRQDVARDPESRLELLEMLQSVQRPAKNQKCPLLADQLDRRRQRAAQCRCPECIHIGSVRQDLSIQRVTLQAAMIA